MAGTLPTVRSGALTLYPLTRSVKYTTNVAVFENATEQRFKVHAPLAEFEFQYRNLNSTDAANIIAFATTQKGAYDPTWSTTSIAGTAYTNMVFTSDVFSQTESDLPNTYTIRFTARQTQNRNAGTPSVTATYPTLANGAVTQLPYTRTTAFSTIANDQECGAHYALAEWGGGLTGFPSNPLHRWRLEYPQITDADLATIETFFRAMNGRWKHFSFTDPDTSITYAKVRFDMDKLDIRYVDYNVTSLTVLLAEYP